MARLAKVFGILVVLLMVVGDLMISCQPALPQPRPASTPGQAVPQSTRFPLTVTGDDGRLVTIKAPPRRIVSFSPGHTEVLYAIGAGNLMVGADEFSDYPPEARSLPKVSYSNIDLEQLVALDPALVILVTRQKSAVAELEKLGLTVLYLTEAGTVDGILDRIRLLGKVTDHEEQAERVAAQMQQRINGVLARLEGVSQGPSVFYELSPELHTAGPSSFIGDILTKLKLRNIAAGIADPFPKLSPEKIIADNPDIVILADPEAGETSETVRARPGWNMVRGAQPSRVVTITNRDIIHRPGPRVAEGIELLARLLYPERFQ